VGGNPFSLLPLLIGQLLGMTPQVTTQQSVTKQQRDYMLNFDGRTDIIEQPFGSKGEQTAYRRLYQNA